MSELPAPLTPSECDLRGFMEWSRFFGEKAFKSHWYRAAMKDPRGGIAALKLWWEAMLQCPAGSLPNDEEELCWLADFGQDIRSWRKHRAVAMHGFVLCADNRWYHPFLADEARRAWERRQHSERTRDQTAERTRQWRERKSNGGDNDVTRHRGHGDASRYASRDAENGDGDALRDARARALVRKRERREEKGAPKSPPPDGAGDTPPLRGRDPYAPDGFGQRLGTRADGTNPRATGSNPRNRPKVVPFSRLMSGHIQAVLEDGFETLQSDDDERQADEAMRADVNEALRLR